MISGRIHLYMRRVRAGPGWPETWTCAWRSVIMPTPLAASSFWMRPIAISLPGICLEEKTTVSPSVIAELVLAERDARERRARLALPAGGDDHHLARRQCIAVVEIDDLREIGEIADALGDAQDAVDERPATQTWRPLSSATSPRVLQPRGVGGEGGDEHAALGPLITPSSPSRTPPSEPDAYLVEHVGRIQTRRGCLCPRPGSAPRR